MISFEKLERNTCKIIAFLFVTEEKIKSRFSDDNFNIYTVDKLLFFSAFFKFQVVSDLY